MRCPKLRENQKKRKEKIRTVTLNVIKMIPFQSGTEGPKTKWTGNITTQK